MRVVCLAPGLTRLLYELGAGDLLVGCSDACRWPPEAAALPVVARLCPDQARVPGPAARPYPDGVPAHDHLASYDLDGAQLAVLRPDLLIHEEACPTCAAAYRPLSSAVSAADATLDGRPLRLVSAAPPRLEDAVGLIEPIAAEIQQPAAGAALLKQRAARLLALSMHVARYLVRVGGERPAVAVLEWADPPLAPGRWVPDLVDAAGGIPLLARAGEPDVPISTEALAAAAPQVLLVGRPGLDPGTASAQIGESGGARLRELPSRARTWVIDYDALLSYPGPHLVDSVETLLRIIIPEALGANGTPPPPTLARPITF